MIARDHGILQQISSLVMLLAGQSEVSLIRMPLCATILCSRGGSYSDERPLGCRPVAATVAPSARPARLPSSLPFRMALPQGLVAGCALSAVLHFCRRTRRRYPVAALLPRRAPQMHTWLFATALSSMPDPSMHYPG